MDSSAEQVIETLGLTLHPEGGHYREIFRDDPGDAGDGLGSDARGAVTAIYYLLAAGEISAWHRVDATEIWHHYAGGPLTLRISVDGVTVTPHILGADLSVGERPQAVVPPFAWQSARSEGAWSLMGCTVSPAFEFSGFEMAPPGWEPGRD